MLLNNICWNLDPGADHEGSIVGDVPATPNPALDEPTAAVDEEPCTSGLSSVGLTDETSELMDETVEEVCGTYCCLMY